MNIKRLNFSAERWAIIAALLSVLVLIVFIMTPRDEVASRLIMQTPEPAQASLNEGDHAGLAPGMQADGHDHAAHGDTAERFACPMMCIPPTDHAGNCPVCGMALIPVEGAPAASGQSRMRFSSEALHLAQIETAPVRRLAVSADVRLFGSIDYDSAHQTVITAFMPGVIDRVYIKRAGQFVRWGAPLFDIYSSDLLETQQQLVAEMQYVPSFLAFQANTPHVAQDMPVQARSKGSGDSSRRTARQEEALQKIAALRHKLSILGLPKRDIDQFMRRGEATGLATVYAPMYGQVIEQKATEGTFINRGTPLFTLADPKYVWARLEAYESDYPWIRIGQTVTFTTEAYPGERFTAQVVNIDPVFDPASRTFSIGAISTEDQGGRLKAGMLVRAVVHAELSADGGIRRNDEAGKGVPLVIPAAAPLITGKRAVVYVAVADEAGVYEGREVLLGPRAGEHYVVRAGLNEGEQVVVNGNFKIDSAMQISARPSLLAQRGGRPMPGHDHGAMPGHDLGGIAAPDETGHRAELPSGMDVEGSLVDGHQHDGLSGQMSADYMRQRSHSRMIVDDDHRDQGGHDQDELRAGSDAEEVSSEYPVRRRKPGSYGDTTRQGADSLEEHRQKWRKSSGIHSGAEVEEHSR